MFRCGANTMTLKVGDLLLWRAEMPQTVGILLKIGRTRYTIYWFDTQETERPHIELAYVIEEYRQNVLDKCRS